ncbi:heavy-metal-associated domain-containing protein [Mycolicibacterium rhodesiae]|nr:heavy metal-associated domain-containing protein [Mycolicibacterium rhodesiae]
MTCDHCVHSVTSELEALDTVTEVAISLVPQGDSSITVTSSAGLTASAVRDAVQRAGYDVVEPASR